MASVQPFSHEKISLPSGLKLEASLSVPSGSQGSTGKDKLAVCLHPWSWLGGRMDDPVLHSVERALLQCGYFVLRYNSRGVGNSSGWPSLTGLQEGQDLQEVVQWALDKIPSIDSIMVTGYSHGALIASLFPLLSEPIKVSHVLLSYPFGPRTWLTAFRSGIYTSALNDLLRNPNSNVLVIYGDHDEFTGEESYNTWAEQLREQTPGDDTGKLEIVKIDGATHFWIEGAQNRLLRKIMEWVL